MPLDATARWRWLGALFLVGALLMLIAGQTVLKPQLTGLVFLAYWLVCFLLTMAAALIALLDATALQRRGRKEHKDLLQKTLGEIEAEAKTRHPEQRRRNQ